MNNLNKFVTWTNCIKTCAHSTNDKVHGLVIDTLYKSNILSRVYIIFNQLPNNYFNLSNISFYFLVLCSVINDSLVFSM